MRLKDLDTTQRAREWYHGLTQLDPAWSLFGRSLEKLVSIPAGVASATFTLAAGRVGVFDSRVWLGTGIDDVVDYFSWRQADAARCALNGWCYWTLRSEGVTARAATRTLDGLDVSGKNELLFERGINFNGVPAWQRRGVGLWFEEFMRRDAVRRRVRVERDLPMGEEYRALVSARAPA